MRRAARAAALIACLAAPLSFGATKAGEGFSSDLRREGEVWLPRDSIKAGRGGDDVYHWIKWKEPIPPTTLRCVVTGPYMDIDATVELEQPHAGAYTFCRIGTRPDLSGAFTFTQYVGGVKAGQRTIDVIRLPPRELYWRGKGWWGLVLFTFMVACIVGYGKFLNRPKSW